VSSYTLFEVSWEVCNKVGGIHTVLATKAKTLVERLGDQYVVVGPWLLGADRDRGVFAEEPGFESFADSCRSFGVPVRIGRWLVPGRPRTILVSFSGLFEKKDGILAGLWERSGVDSLNASWEYVEPVLFGHAAGLVIERWWEEFLAYERSEVVAQFHEWLTGSGMLHISERVPSIGTVFTTHATILGRTLAARGEVVTAVTGQPEALAHAFGIASKHSMESACARQADVFTTVSELTSDEAMILLRRRADPILPNGIDLAVMDELRAGTSREAARKELVDLAARFLGQDVATAALLGTSGRYEFHNKGVDVLVDALAILNRTPGRRLVLFVMMPAGNSGIRPEVLERMRSDPARLDGPIGLSTHNLFDPEGDPLCRRCAQHGLDNAPDARVRIVFIPIYLNVGDGLLDLPYEAVLQGLDLTCFPSFYEPWGYTPEESLAVGVPTITSDCAGFGRWAQEEHIGIDAGVIVLERQGVDDAQAAKRLAVAIEDFLARPREDARVIGTCRRTALRTAWSDLVENYERAFAAAIAHARERMQKSGAPPFRPRRIEQRPASPPSARPTFRSVEVATRLPSSLTFLERLAGNYWWSWNVEARRLYSSISATNWWRCGHNPVSFLRTVFARDLERVAEDRDYIARLGQVRAAFDAYMGAAPAERKLPSGARVTMSNPIAYFCAEFAVHESLAIFSGGLGVLAADHLKSASDSRLPLVGVGLFYQKGYFRQRVGRGGEQIALDSISDPLNIPLEVVRNSEGAPLRLKVQFPESTVHMRAWLARVGRVPLYLIDTNLPENRPEDRAITDQLYGGGEENRLRQEIVLGRGGVLLLGALGIEPSVLHLNEGHAAFAAWQRVSQLVHERGLTFQEARLAVRASTAFTTHTPVAAGHDRFGEDLIRRYFSDSPAWVGIPWDAFFQLGTSAEETGAFNMTYLALAFAGFVNGVSRHHGDVSRKLLHRCWPRLLLEEVPIHSITNGVHLPTWTHPDMARVLGVEGRPVSVSDFAGCAERIDHGELWEARNRLRRGFLGFLGSHLQRTLVERGESPATLGSMLQGLEGAPLVLGFARRFAPYKRARLLLRDLERLTAILSREDRPVRVIFSGKAHPRDTLGQEILREIVLLSRGPLLGKLYFLEDYGLHVARRMVAGVDVWLNNPTRGLEASGTSGMKAAVNGALNLSIADGWWIEGKRPGNGWTIGEEQIYPIQDLQDEVDAEDLYRLLEDEIVPAFYERDAAGLPRAWLERIVESMATIPPEFNTDRMVAEYWERAYAPLAARHVELARSGYASLREAAGEHARLRRGFEGLRVLGARVEPNQDLVIGNDVEVQVDVDLSGLSPEDVIVEFLHGTVGRDSSLTELQARALKPVPGTDGQVSFVGTERLRRSGPFTYALRVRARAPDLTDLVVWITP
jgi:phosphorylase/glycogen(starch) synthase